MWVDLVSALDAVTAVQSRLSIRSAALERASKGQQDFQDFAATQLTGLTGGDVAAVRVQLTCDRTQLLASYAGWAKVQGLSLRDDLG